MSTFCHSSPDIQYLNMLIKSLKTAKGYIIITRYIVKTCSGGSDRLGVKFQPGPWSNF